MNITNKYVLFLGSIFSNFVMNFKRNIKKLQNKLKDWLYHKTTTENVGNYTLTTVKPRFKTIKPKRKYKSAYVVVEGNSNVIIQNV